MVPEASVATLAYLSSIFPSEMAENSLGAMSLLLPEVDQIQSLPSVLPFIPFIFVVNVLCNGVELCLAGPIMGLWLSFHRLNKLVQCQVPKA